jgi:preprotein translocase SecF subunit
MFQLLVGTDIPFMKHRRVAYVVSGGLVLATAIWLIANRGPRLSVDFTGGTLVQIRTTNELPADQVREAFEAAGLRGFELQQLIGEHRNEFFVRFGVTGPSDPYPLIEKAIKTRFPRERVELRRTESVGPKIGDELRRKAVWAVLGSLGGILVYVGMRYEFKFAFGAIAALFHDVFVTVGVLCFANREISLTVLAALLTIAGFSINDTIVIFDRIRERAKSMRNERRSRIMDVAVNETLARTAVTTLTVLFTALALLFFGGEALFDFSLALVVGLVLGTYSTVYVASGLALDTWIWLDRRKGMTSE